MAEARFQAIAAELAQTRAQVLAVTQAHDTLQAAHEALNTAAQTAMQQRMVEIRDLEDRMKTQIFQQKVELLDTKDMKPGGFHGKRSESFRQWARKLRAFCNAKSPGMRVALEWAEEQKDEINSPDAVETGCGYRDSRPMDGKLHDFLVQLCGDGALVLIDTPVLRGRGFEAWRQLKNRYAPTGGAFDLDALMSLMKVSPCKDLASLPDTLAKWERQLNVYERQSGETFPVGMKVPLFMEMLPKSHKEEIRMRFEQGTRTYDELV